MLRDKIFYEWKEIKFREHSSLKWRKKWYYQNYKSFGYLKIRYRVLKWIAFLLKIPLPMYLSFFRWMLIDFLRGKERRFKGIYQFVGLPGEGKTISMVAHIERAKHMNPDVLIATNFNYVNEDVSLHHWIDIINFALDCQTKKCPCVVAIDEIQNTFDASDFKSFPAPLYSLLSFNRKLNLQFLCSAQIYDRIPSKIRALANYTIICKNVLKADRYFRTYYFEKNNYEEGFSGKRARAEFTREFIADDLMYSRYNTLEQVQEIKGKACEEKDKMEQAFDLLFGREKEEDAETAEGL